MRALDLEVVDAVWEAIEPRIPVPPDTHPLGCHRPRIPDRLCFIEILIRLVSGDSWVNVESTMKLLGHQVSDTTLRQRRDEWVAIGVFGQLVEEAIEAYDRIIGLELEDVALDGSVHKAPWWRGRNRLDRIRVHTRECGSSVDVKSSVGLTAFVVTKRKRRRKPGHSPAEWAYLSDIGQRVRARRAELGWSQEQLGERAEIDATYVGAIERGERNVGVIKIGHLASALEINPGQLFEGLSPRR